MAPLRDRLPSRRSFMTWLSMTSAALVNACTSHASARVTRPPVASELAGSSPTRPGRASGAHYLGNFAAPKLERVRCAFIGVGARGSEHVKQVAMIEGADIVGICDLHADLVERSTAVARERGHRNVSGFAGDAKAYHHMLDQCRPDAVFIATPWQAHATQAIDSMRAGAHAFVEVPLALTVDELWRIIDTAEQSQRHCMMLENVCYGREELLYLNIVRQGLLGTLLHGEAAYIHDLRKQMHEEHRGTGSWRTYHYANRNGNLYPTHGLGPVAQYMSLARGDDNFARLVSLSSPAAGRALYASKHFPADHAWNKLHYTGGDLNTSIIQTNQGRTIMVQWDETSPRPYSRHNLIQGSAGLLAGFPGRYAIEAFGDTHAWSHDLQPLYARYEHPLYQRIGSIAEKMGGHGGMDFLMLYRVIECLRRGEALDQNLYEGALWSAVAPLSAASVQADGQPQPFPDFTRGEASRTLPLGIVA